MRNRQVAQRNAGSRLCTLTIGIAEGGVDQPHKKRVENDGNDDAVNDDTSLPQGRAQLTQIQSADILPIHSRYLESEKVPRRGRMKNRRLDHVRSRATNLCAMSRRCSASYCRRDPAAAETSSPVECRQQPPHRTTILVPGFQDCSRFCESRRQPRGRAGTSSGYPACVGKGRHNDLDPQDRRTYGERFHTRCEDRSALGLSVVSCEMSAVQRGM